MHVRTVCTIFSMAIATIVCTAQQPTQGVSRDSRYGRLPVTFEENRGQTDPQVKFLARAKGYTAFLTADGIVLSLRPTEVVKAAPSSHQYGAQSARSTNTALEFKLTGTTKNLLAVGEDPQPGRINYFIGNDRSKWRTNVPTYRRVRYKNVYPGIDLIYYGHNRELEYDFAVAPHADPDGIQFEVKGSRRIEIDTEGDLIVKMSDGELRFKSPSMYQESNGIRVPLQGAYIIKSPTRVGFHVADFDPSKPLLIDPLLDYSTYLGGSGNDNPAGIAVDASGCVYVTGDTDSTDFPLAALGSLPPGTEHVFVAKFDASGSNLIYADYIGGNTEDDGYAIALNSANEVYLTGSTASSDFPVVNAYQPTYPGSFNAFLTRISSDGSSLLYSTYLGGNGEDTPVGVAVDNLSDVLVAGTTSSTNFPIANAYQSTASPNQGGLYGSYGFLTKFTPDGSSLVYSTYLAGSSNLALNCGGTPCWPNPTSNVAGMALDSAGNAYVVGNTNTYDFPTTSGAYSTTDSTNQDAAVGFVSKISSSGSLQYSTYFYESSGFTNMSGIAVDSSGSAYVTGWAYSNGTFPITSTSICDPGISGVACSYTFVTKFDPAGSTLAYSTFLGANNYAVPAAIVVDQNNNAYVLSTTTSSSFVTVNGLQPYAGQSDVLLVEIDPLASSQLFATYFGGSGNETAAAMAIDAGGNLYLTGTTVSTDFPTTQQAFQQQAAGNNDGFVMKIGTVAPPSVALTPGSLTFASTPLGSTSSAQQVMLSNSGGSALTIGSISVAGDFAETNDCRASVPAGGNCSLSVTFTPTAAGQRNGSIVIQDDAAGSSQVITLVGTGSGGAAASLSATSLTFGSQVLLTHSSTATITLTNSGSGVLNVSGVQASGDFAQTNNCPATISTAASCTVGVTFTPTLTGTRSGTLIITDDAPNSPQTVALSGSGSDFTLTSSPSSSTVKAGSTATYAVEVVPVGGAFANVVQLSCSGIPAYATCSLSSNSVTPGSTPATVTVSINTTAASADLKPLEMPRNPILPAVWLQLQGFGLFGVIVFATKRSSKRLRTVPILMFLVGSLLLLVACAGGIGGPPQKQPGTQAGTYTITLTGNSGTLQHSESLTLTVQ